MNRNDKYGYLEKIDFMILYIYVIDRKCVFYSMRKFQIKVKIKKI